MFIRKSKLKEIIKSKIQEFSLLSKNDSNNKSKDYRANTYRDYEGAVMELSRRYEGDSNWGVAQTGSLTTVIAAFTIGQGLEVTKKKNIKDAEYELGFANELLKFNKLDEDGALENAKESEIEGKFLLVLKWDKEAEEHEWTYEGASKTYVGMPKVRFLPWTQYKYEVSTADGDYKRIIGVKWDENQAADIREDDLTEEMFSYRKFGGRIYKPNSPMQPMWACMDAVENYDRCLRDLRKINHLFASPTPVALAENKESGKVAAGLMDGKNWRIGKTVGGWLRDFKMVGVDTGGVQNLLAEKVTLQKRISGISGVLAHFYDPEIMSNKALGNDALDFQWANMLPRRQVNKSIYTEITEKSMALFVQKTKSEALNANKIQINIQMITQSDYERLVNVWLPLQLNGLITPSTLLEMAPGINAEDEIKKREEEKNKVFKDMKDGRTAFTNEDDDGDPEKNE